MKVVWKVLKLLVSPLDWIVFPKKFDDFVIIYLSIVRIILWNYFEYNLFKIYAFISLLCIY